jgi:hypothetical protein
MNKFSVTLGFTSPQLNGTPVIVHGPEVLFAEQLRLVGEAKVKFPDKGPGFLAVFPLERMALKAARHIPPPPPKKEEAKKEEAKKEEAKK